MADQLFDDYGIGTGSQNLFSGGMSKQELDQLLGLYPVSDAQFKSRASHTENLIADGTVDSGGMNLSDPFLPGKAAPPGTMWELNPISNQYELVANPDWMPIRPYSGTTLAAPAVEAASTSAPLSSGQSDLFPNLKTDSQYSAPQSSAPTSVLGMFPEVEAMQRALYQQKQNEAMQAQAMQFARLSPMERAQYSLYMGGQQLGGAIGGALGAKDPQMQMISLQNQMLRMVDPNKPETYDRAISLALQTGDRNTALILNDEKKSAQARKTENLQLGLQKLAQTLYKPDGSIDENVYATLQSYGAVGQAVIDQQAKGFQGLQTQKAQSLGRRLFNTNGTINQEIQRQLQSSPEGIKVLKEFTPERVTMKEGEIMYSVPTTVGGEFTPILSGGKKPEPFTGEMANAANLLFQTTDPAKIFAKNGQSGLDEVARKAEEISIAKRPVTNVNIQNSQQKGFGDELTTITTGNIRAGRAAVPAISSIKNMQVLLDEGVKTGFGQSTVLQLGKAGQFFNPDFNIRGLAGTEAFDAFSTNVILPQAKQLGTNPTDKDLAFVERGAPTLSKTVAGNKLILSALELKLEREKDLSRFTNDWIAKNNKLTVNDPVNAYTKWNTDVDTYMQSSPLYAPSSEKLREQFNALSNTARSGNPDAKKAVRDSGLVNP